MMRFIDEDEGPDAFWAMEPNERSRRARVYLVSLSSGEHPLMAWLAAVSDNPDDVPLIHELVDVLNEDDKRIEAMLRDFQSRRRQAVLV